MKLLLLAVEYPRRAATALLLLATPAALILGARAIRAAVERRLDETAGAT